MKSLVIWIAAYLYGCIPFIDALARMRSVNLKDVGSGNVGATNLMSIGGARLAIVGWLFDASKGLLPVVVARRLGLSPSAAGVAGVCGAAGQCWPVTLRFSGGRGISAFIGASYAMDPMSWLVALVPFVVGSVWRLAPAVAASGPRIGEELRTHRSRSVPLGSLLGVLTFPAAMWIFGRGPLTPAVLLALLILVRRVTAPLPDDVVEGPAEESRALVYRLLYDRNTAA
jgi:acyl-phosphate glycerol 3-phosphate acyltransferase